MRQVLTPADDAHHINKHNFKVPFVCGCRDLGEALRRIAEGAAMIRTKGALLLTRMLLNVNDASVATVTRTEAMAMLLADASGTPVNLTGCPCVSQT